MQAFSTTSLRDCYIRSETSLRLGCHISTTPLDLINEEQPAQPSEDEQMMIISGS
jgi:hypothetical protein